MTKRVLAYVLGGAVGVAMAVCGESSRQDLGAGGGAPDAASADEVDAEASDEPDTGDLDGACGVGSDGCGGTIDCGPCSMPEARLAAMESSVAEDVPAGNVEVVVTLSEASTQTVTVDYALSDLSAWFLPFGTGRDYYCLDADNNPTASGTVTFPPGVTSQTVAVWIRDDDISELTERFRFALTAASNARLGDASRCEISITDDDAVLIVNVQAPPPELTPCVGDGITDDGPAMRDIFHYVAAQAPKDDAGRRHGGLVYFPAGTYVVGNWCNLADGVAYVSDQRAEIVRVEGYNQGWIWTIVDANYYDNAADSHPLVIKGLQFDGRATAGLDQPHNVRIAGGTAKVGRLRLYVEESTSENAWADGFALGANLDAVLYRIGTGHSGRNGLTFIGGNTTADIREYAAEWDGTEIEVSAAGLGLGPTGPTKRVDLTFHDVALHDAIFQMGGPAPDSGGTSTVTADNVQQTITVPDHYTAAWADFFSEIGNISHASFGRTQLSYMADNTTHTFDNCSFDTPAQNLANPADPELYAGVSLWFSATRNKTVTFQHSRFTTRPEITDEDRVVGVRTGTGAPNSVNFADCEFDGKFDWCVDTALDQVQFKNTVFRGDSTGYVAHLSSWGGTSPATARVTFDNCTVLTARHLSLYPAAPVHITFVDQSLRQENNYLKLTGGSIDNVRLTGVRKITGTFDPTTASVPPHGFVGDEYTLEGTNHWWKCSQPGFERGDGTQQEAEWQPQPDR